jgi:acetoin utilization deacetylase AcuC-like enzyme
MIYTHPACLQHFPGPGHPEAPERLQAVLKALATPEFADLPRIEAPRVERALVERVHPGIAFAQVFAHAPHAELLRLDADTVMHPAPASLEAALRAAGAVVAAVDALLDGRARRAFCAVRPPGHHATPERPMGFCVFNNVALAATHALERGLTRVAVLDFDVHHGNGSQDCFAHEPRVLFASSHQWPLYPGSGRLDETGVGNVFNAHLPAGSGSREFRTAWGDRLLPAVDAFRPQLILVSAGFDAHRLDPLGGLDLDDDDYAWITREIVAIAERHGGGRVVSTLEGGYSLTALAEAGAAHVRALLLESAAASRPAARG